MEPLTQGAGVQEGGLREQPGDEKEGCPGVQEGGLREQPADEKEGVSSPPITDGDPGPVPSIPASGPLSVRAGEYVFPSWDCWDELNSRGNQSDPSFAACLCFDFPLRCNQHSPSVSSRGAAEGAASAHGEMLATVRPPGRS